MFNNLFNRNKSDKKQAIDNTPQIDERKLAFQMLILNYLKKYDFDNNYNSSYLSFQDKKEDENWVNQTLEFLGFRKSIEKIIINEWKEKQILSKTLSEREFAELFIKDFHNLKVEKLAPENVRDRNKKLIEAYKRIIQTIIKTQGWLQENKLRTMIESDFRNKKDSQFTIFQCTTNFCVVSLGCDQMGRYNIVYSVDYRIQEMISQVFASTLIRRIYEFTPGELEPFVRIGSLFEDCTEIFEKIIQESKIENIHTVKTNPMHFNE